MVGTGIGVPCDALPLVLEPCDCCGFEVPFIRGFKWISKQYISKLSYTAHEYSIHGNVFSGMDKCICRPRCPICHFDNNDLSKYGLMWVGERHYTPHSFIREAELMGVSKKIAKLPKDIVFGKTWIVLAHKKVPIYNGVRFGELNADPKRVPAIFSAFIPRRVEMLIFKKDATLEKLEQLRKQGITPVVIKYDKTHE